MQTLFEATIVFSVQTAYAGLGVQLISLECCGVRYQALVSQPQPAFPSAHTYWCTRGLDTSSADNGRRYQDKFRTVVL